MKSNDIQKVVLSKYKNEEMPTKIFRDLCGVVSLSTIKRWCNMIDKTGRRKLCYSTSRKRSARCMDTICKAKRMLKNKKLMSAGKMATKLNVSDASMRRILKSDLQCKPYKIIDEPRIEEVQKRKRKTFTNWIRTNYRKNETMNFVFSGEKYFDLDGVYNRQND